MSTFRAYLEIGLNHITDIQGYDHILFIIALCATYSLRDIKNILIMVTAFTLGHSVTLVLAALDIIPVNSFWVELLIPITIIITSLYNMLPSAGTSRFDRFKYLMAVGFGLIHGLGFSSFFKVMLGRESEIVTPLFAFNVGLEIGQIAIVLAFLLLEGLLYLITPMKKRPWILVVSGATMGISIILVIEKLIAG